MHLELVSALSCLEMDYPRRLIGMTFRRDCFLLWSTQIVCVEGLAICLLILPVDQIKTKPALAIPFVLLVVLFGGLLCATPKLYNKNVTIDEKGISCQQGNEQLWSFLWDEIECLQRSSRYCMPSLEIKVKQDGVSGKIAPIHLYFQLSRAAKAALQKYQPKSNLM